MVPVLIGRIANWRAWGRPRRGRACVWPRSARYSSVTGGQCCLKYSIRAALMALSMLLFGQGVLAATRCDWLQRSSARAIASGEFPPCHETAQKQRNLNLCLADCQSPMQSVDKRSVPVHAKPPTPVLVVEQFALSADGWLPAVFPFAIISAGAPPPRILFHQFLV